MKPLQCSILARDIVAGYRGRRVLHKVDITVAPGEFVGLIGPNGCGKSTLMRVLSGTLPKLSGSVMLEDREIDSWSRIEVARRIAFVPQVEQGQFEFTVRDVVLMGRYVHRTGAKRDALQDYEVMRAALASADILDLESRSVSKLSGGEFRRVLLARALAQQAPLLLLDEPTAHLDIRHQIDLMRITLDLVRINGVGALAALHDLNQAAEYCDRLVLLHEGAVAAVGSPAEVLTPDLIQTVYGVRATLGVNPMSGKMCLFAGEKTN